MIRKCKIIFFLVSSFFITSCTLHPRYERSYEVEIPCVWRFSSSIDEANDQIVWWKSFNDLELDALVEEALANNQDVKAAIARVDQFAAQLGIAESSLWPQINATSDAARAKEQLPAAAGSLISNMYSLIANASYFVDLWGEIRSQTEAAKAELLSSVEVRRSVVQTLISALATAYIQLRQFDKQLIIAENTLKSRKRSYEIADIRFELGLTSLMPVEQAQSEVEVAEFELLSIDNSIGVTEDLICVLIGKPSQIIERGKGIDWLKTPPAVPSFLPSELLNQRPDILAAEQLLIAANAQIGVARAAFFPQVSLIGAYGTESTQFNDLFKNSSTIWQYGATLLQEIFTGGRLTNTLKFTKAQKMEALHNYQSIILTAFQEVNDALISHKIAMEQVEVQRSRVETVKEYLFLARKRYEEGLTDYLNYLDAQRQFFQAELDYAEAQGNSFVTVIQIYNALGGYWVLDADNEVMEQSCL